MKNMIQDHLANPAMLEQLYRSNRAEFKKAFNALYPSLPEDSIAQCWYQRLHEEGGTISWGKKHELIFVIVAALVATLIAKVPAIFNVKEEFFYPRNISFIVFPTLMAYFIWMKRLSSKIMGVAAVLLAIAAVYINLLPENENSDTFILACIHLPLFAWALTGFVYTGGSLRDWSERPEYLRLNGDLIVMGSLISSVVMALTGITIGLFSLIGLHIEEFYTNWILIAELCASPLVATYVVKANPQLVNKVSPVIARIFSPLVLITLVAYLVGIAVAKKDPFNDRDFLLLFNVLLIGVLAIIFFSVIEMHRSAANQISLLIILLLSGVTIIVNAIALSAILFRISSWGITPNRLAVLGGNILFFTNLIMIARQLYLQYRGKASQHNGVEKSIAIFLPVYAAWAMIVLFLFPLIFGFR